MSVQTSMAQVTIGTDTPPDPDALLDMKVTSAGVSNKGLLLPRVNLIAPTNPSPLTAHVEGMLVYNKISNANIQPGVFYNTGDHWERIDILPGAGPGQAIMSDNARQPRWGALDFPDQSSVGYVMRKFTVSDELEGAVFYGNLGYDVTEQNFTYDEDYWAGLNTNTPFSVTPGHTKNRLIVTMQTMIQSNSQQNNPGWVDYAGGVFINNALKVVKLGQFSHTGNYAFDIMTMYLIVEDLPLSVAQDVKIAVTRLNSGHAETVGIGTPVITTNLSNFMAKPFISIQYYEDPSSPTTN